MTAPPIYPSDTDQSFTYGAPLRPSTPMRAVIGNFYGEIAGFQQKVRVEQIRYSDENLRK